MADTPYLFGQVRVDDDGRIDEPLACIHCGQELRGQLPDASCPKCRTPIDDSAHGDLLRFQSPAWLSHILLGLAVLILGIVIALGVGTIKVLAWMDWLPIATIQSMGWFAASWLPLVISAVGLWFVASRQPLDFGPEPPLSVRRVAQWSAAAAAGLAVLLFLSQGFSSGWGTTMGLRNIVRLPWLALIQGTWLVAVFTGCLVGEQLARRYPDARLGQQLSLASWIVTAGLGLVYAHVYASSVAMFVYRPSGTLADEELGSVYYSLVYTGYVVNMLVVPVALWVIALLAMLLLRVRQASQRYRGLD